MENRIYYYARVSTKEQNLDRQLAAFKALGASERDIITDKESGKNLDRAGYQALKTTMLRTGDTLVVKSLDRLSRNKGDIKAELQYFKEHGIRVKIIDLPTTMTDFPTGQEWVLEMINNILIEVLGTIAEQERATIKQRQREGIESARSKGKHLGRPTLKRPENWKEVYMVWRNGDITAKEAMRQTGLKRSSFYRLVRNEKER
ncbi:MAG: recombinase family protein [Oscillospiraceae bacterium]|nr:recombinase family protein [Oscillospiraceae bacterium]